MSNIWLVLVSGVTLIILAREERGLEAAFGQTYVQYKNRLPRWLGKSVLRSGAP